ncbi:hypothetical protein B5E87_14305 [Massilimicrobiota sp. An142]|nr:hypothetical protein B5E87_14305 [Massilimicrobiota sp. An142]OUQ74506.1 hypothetical protein B5E48_12420 [Massilimicrobiota sp. An105]
MLYIGLYTGIRIAEVLALTRVDVDLKNKTITIKKQLHDEIENYIKQNRQLLSYQYQMN